MRRNPVALACLFAISTSHAAHSPVEEILVDGSSTDHSQLIISDGFAAQPIDSAALLKTLPGANVNSNGPITGIVQYRGLSGNRVNIHIDRSPALTGGPNSMDTPLSYTPPLLLKELQVQRGIASVSSGQETLGGHINAVLDRGEFNNSETFTLNGSLSSRFNGNTDGASQALKTSLANDHHKLAILASHDEGDDTRIGNNDTLAGTEYRRTRYDLSYGWQSGDNSLEIFTGQLDTRNTGTPALPMDIIYIDSDLAGINGSTTLGGAKITAQLAYNHVDHGMDNFSYRLAPMPGMQRFNHATARNQSWSLTAQWPLENGSLTLGTDGNQSIHNSEISNPNNSMFAVHNFNDIERDILGLFAEWKTRTENWELETGIRYNRVETNASDVSASGMTGMMATNVAALVSRFNSDDRSHSDDNVDMVLKASTDLNDSLNLELGLGIKNRAPSYQERYLWLPLSATGGLADGRSYIGNLNLDSETAYEITAGLNWQGDKGWLSPQLFYRQIDNYIQGAPTTDMLANMVSTMMSGQPALAFTNVNAEMIGFDMAYGYQLSEHLSLQGNLSYVRGENTDNNDDLYRIAPLNNRLALVYQGDDFSLAAESMLYAKQSRVAEFNNEQSSSGYGIVNLSGQYEVTGNIRISAGVQNLFDKRYQDHLAGYNRNGNSDIAVGERLIGTGRNAWLAVTLNW